MKHKKSFFKRLLSVILSALLITGCLISSGHIYEVSAANETVSGIYFYDIANRILELVNQERAAAGLSPLKMDAELQTGAMLRSVETTIRFEHVRPNGTQWYTICDKSYGENIGQNIGFSDVAYASMYGDGSGKSGWMNSTNHRKNILSDSFVSIGIGVFKNSAGYYYVTQEFGYADATGALHSSTQEAVTICFDAKGNPSAGSTPAPTTEAPTTAAPTTATPTTVAPTTEAPTTIAPTTVTPTTVTPTTAKPSVAVPTVSSINVTLSKSSYPIGYTLKATDFKVIVTMSDGSKLTNPSGWSVNTMLVDGSTPIVVVYGNKSVTVPIKIEKPAETTAKETTVKETTIKETTIKETTIQGTTQISTSESGTSASDGTHIETEDETTEKENTEPEVTTDPSSKSEDNSEQSNKIIFNSSVIKSISPIDSKEVNFIALIKDDSEEECALGVIEIISATGDIISASLGISFSGEFYQLPKERLGIFILSNCIDQLIRESASVIRKDPAELPADYSFSITINGTKNTIIRDSDGVYNWYLTDNNGKHSKVDLSKNFVDIPTSPYEESSSPEEDTSASFESGSSASGTQGSTTEEAIATEETATTNEELIERPVSNTSVADANTAHQNNSSSSEEKSINSILIASIICLASFLIIIIILLIILLFRKNKKEEAKQPEVIYVADRRKNTTDRRGPGAVGGRRSTDLQPGQEPKRRATDNASENTTDIIKMREESKTQTDKKDE